MTVKKDSAEKKETKPAEKPTTVKKPALKALQKVLKVINSHRAGIYKQKFSELDHNNKKGFADMDDRVHIKSLINLYKVLYTESDILDKKSFNFGEGCIVFKDGQKYTVKKQDGDFVVV